ncbi:MAG TPA: FecR domain-containing protein [Prolixibacteraceae bacterium]|nr:FecR domain-containing protein [Prolixibacteraceae bacterium]
MKEQIDYKILKNFACGKYSLRDFVLVSRWFEDKNNETELKNTIQEHWDEFSEDNSVGTKDLSLVLNQLKQKIASEKTVVNFRIKIQKFYTKAAAILLLPLLLYSVYSTFFKSQAPEIYSAVEIVSPHGARTHFKLPDGTQGWLNSGSSLKYETSFLKKRNIELIGEAWFEVTHDDKKPFNVHTKSLDVLDLGTKFNVAAYADEIVTEVVLQEGKVNVNGNKGQYTVNLVPNEKFTFDRNLQSGTVQKVNAEQFIAWKDGLLVFRNEPLSEVLKRVGRWYNVEIIMDDPDLAAFKYRATFQEEQVDEVIRLISLTVPIEYSFDNREVNVDGIFKKRTITIRRKSII